MIELLYKFSVQFYYFVILFFSLFHDKAALWVRGRKTMWDELQENNFEQGNWIWIHCASLGEFEQSRTIIEHKEIQAHFKVILTFYSPSGYENKKDYKYAEVITYLPLDTKKNAERFLQIIQPKLAVFIRYEFWFNHLRLIHRQQIPIYLVSASFRKQQLFFKPLVGQWFRQILTFYTMIFTIDDVSIKILNQFHIDNCRRLGDTRADRVLAIASQSQHFEKIVKFKNNKKLVICGSAWLRDIYILEKIIKDSISGDVSWIIAPHEVDNHSIESIVTLLARHQSIIIDRYSSNIINTSAHVLIIDNIGILSKIYQYADLVYVGGGFGKGIHNVIEPAVFACPVLFGPRYHKFPEAKGLITANGGFTIANETEAYEKVDYLLNHDAERKALGRNASQYVISSSGATETIVKELIKVET